MIRGKPKTKKPEQPKAGDIWMTSYGKSVIMIEPPFIVGSATLCKVRDYDDYDDTWTYFTSIANLIYPLDKSK
jgi:hypothetical protein